MIINWYTVIFQVINFLVLVFLLRRFLYGPIIKVMEEREQKIAQREDVAVAKAAEAQQEALAYRQKTEALQHRLEAVVDEARAEAENERRGLVEAARIEVDETRKHWNDALHREQESFLHELGLRVGRQACLVAKQCLQELADVKLQDMVWNVFEQKLKQLVPQERTRLQNALSQEQRVILRSAFHTSDEWLQKVTAFLNDYFKHPFQVETQTRTDLICGLELEVGGYKVAWSVESYLDGVEKQILGVLQSSEKEDTLDVAAES